MMVHPFECAYAQPMARGFPQKRFIFDLDTNWTATLKAGLSYLSGGGCTPNASAAVALNIKDRDTSKMDVLICNLIKFGFQTVA